MESNCVELDDEADVKVRVEVNDWKGRSLQESTLSSSNRTPSDCTPSGGYQLRGHTGGYGVKRKREMMIEKVKKERTVTAMKGIHASMDGTISMYWTS